MFRQDHIPALEADPHITYPISYEPYYTKFTTCECGVVIKSCDSVSEEAHQMAKTIVDFMLLKLPEASAILKGAGAQLAIYPKHRDAYDIPEHRAGCYSYIVLWKAWWNDGDSYNIYIRNKRTTYLRRAIYNKIQTRMYPST